MSHQRIDGRPRLTPEDRHPVGMSLSLETIGRLEALAGEMDLSLSITATWCVLSAADELSRSIGWGPIEMPQYIEDRIRAIPLCQSPAKTKRKPAGSRIGVQARIPESRYELLCILAEEFDVATSQLCAWLLVRHMNSLLLAAGKTPLTLPDKALRHLPVTLLMGSVQNFQDALVPFGAAQQEEERLAS